MFRVWFMKLNASHSIKDYGSSSPQVCWTWAAIDFCFFVLCWLIHTWLWSGLTPVTVLKEGLLLAMLGDHKGYRGLNPGSNALSSVLSLQSPWVAFYSLFHTWSPTLASKHLENKNFMLHNFYFKIFIYNSGENKIQWSH